jgi:hypothetical protein
MAAMGRWPNVGFLSFPARTGQAADGPNSAVGNAFPAFIAPNVLLLWQMKVVAAAVDNRAQYCDEDALAILIRKRRDAGRHHHAQKSSGTHSSDAKHSCSIKSSEGRPAKCHHVVAPSSGPGDD